MSDQAVWPLEGTKMIRSLEYSLFCLYGLLPVLPEMGRLYRIRLVVVKTLAVLKGKILESRYRGYSCSFGHAGIRD
jgi:hypothetical protein